MYTNKYACSSGTWDFPSFMPRKFFFFFQGLTFNHPNQVLGTPSHAISGCSVKVYGKFSLFLIEPICPKKALQK